MDRFTNDFFATIQIRCQFDFIFIHMLKKVIATKLCYCDMCQNMLRSDDQKLNSMLQQIENSFEFELWGKVLVNWVPGTNSGVPRMDSSYWPVERLIVSCSCFYLDLTSANLLLRNSQLLLAVNLSWTYSDIYCLQDSIQFTWLENIISAFCQYTVFREKYSHFSTDYVPISWLRYMLVNIPVK